MAEIYILKIIEFPKNIEEDSLKIISAEREKRIHKYKFIQDSYRSFLAEALARYSICIKYKYNNKDLIFDVSKYGKPYLKYPCEKPVYFNFSHAGNYVVCAVDDKNCGIDVESSENFSMDLAKYAFFSKEILQLESFNDYKESAEYFTFLWTMKEAYIKALGVGLSKSLSSFYISKINNKISIVDFEDKSQRFSTYESLNIDDKYTVSFVGESKAEYHYITDVQLMEYIKDWRIVDN